MTTLIYTFTSAIVTLLVSLKFATVIEFESPVLSYVYGGSESDILIDLLSNDKILSIKPRIDQINSNLLVITKNGKFNFTIKTDNLNPHKFVTIKYSKIDELYKIKANLEDFTLLEGETTLKIIPKKPPLNVNEEEIISSRIFPKGAPLFINGKSFNF